MVAAVIIVTPSQETVSSCYAYPLVIIRFYLQCLQHVVKIDKKGQIVNLLCIHIKLTSKANK